MAASELVRLYAVLPTGAERLPTPAGARAAHDVFDGLPLGVYTGLRTFHHDRFLGLEQHLDRTERCMRLLGWQEPLERHAIRRALDGAVREYPGADCFVRLDVLAEPPTELGTSSRTLCCLSPFTPIPEDYLRDGVRVEIAAELHRHDPRIKTADFVISRRPYPLNRKESFEHLLLDAEGGVLEGTSSNFYAVRAGVVQTAGEDMLEGITRRYVLRLCAELGLEVRLAPPRADELGQADEAFLSSSSRGIVPVVAVASTRIGAGRPGPLTRALLEAYRSLVEREARAAWPPPGAPGE